MNNEKKKLLKSYLIFLGGILILLVFFFSFLYHLNVSKKIKKLESDNKVVLSLMKKDLEERYIDYIDDLKFLSETPQLKSLFYNKSNLLKNEDYLEEYLKIKSDYIAGRIKNNNNSVIVDEAFEIFYSSSKKKKKLPTNKLTISKLKNYDDSYITRISIPILGYDNTPLGSVSLYQDHNFFIDILDKYTSTELLASEDFLWFGVYDNKIFNPSGEVKDILDDSYFITLLESGAILNDDSLIIFDTVDLSKKFPNLVFDKKTPHIWKFLIKVPQEDLELIKKQNLDGFLFLGTIIFLFIAMTLWAILKEYYSRKFYEEQLELKNSKLIENNKTKDKFISILAHDLKSPFTGITGIFSILTRKYDTYDDSKKKKLIFSLNDSIHGIHSLLTNLLEWSRIQRGHIAFSPMKVKVNDTMTTVSRLLNLNIETKNIKLLNHISDKHFVWGDKYMIETIFRNILSNAVKFTPNFGEIELNSKKKDDYIYIYVKDSGVGMSLDTQTKLFKLDENMTTLGTANEKGTGLGLVITKEFIALNNGKLEVDSVEHEGTTFIIKLPAYRDLHN